MTPLTAEEIAELRRLEREAAPSPWRAERTGHEEEDAVTRVIQPRFSQNAAVCGTHGDGQFIATARNALPRLLDEVERSRRIPLADEADVKKLLAIIERSRALLKRIEWGLLRDECPACGGPMVHKPGCELAALIAGTEGAPNLLPVLQRLVDAVTESGRKGVVYLGPALGDAREALRLSGVRQG